MKTTKRSSRAPYAVVTTGVMLLCAGTWLAQPMRAHAQAAADKDKPDAKKTVTDKDKESTDAELSNWVELTLGGAVVHGNTAEFQRHTGMREGASGGVADFHFEEYLTKKGLLEIDGRGISDNHDYSLSLAYRDPDKGYVRAGYREYRTWYDGGGGYWPRTGAYLTLADPQLAVDRGEIYFEAGLTLPEKPIISFEYHHFFRDGNKDSTSWGESRLLGPGLAAGSDRRFVPSFYDLNETRDAFSLDVKHTLGKTEFGIGARYEFDSNNDSRNEHKRPGEGSVAPLTDRYLTQREIVDASLFNVHTFTETRFTEKLWLTTGYSFTTMDTDVSGSRVYGAGYNADFSTPIRTQARDEGYYNLFGGSEMRQHVGNINVMYQPMDDLYLVTALRIEKYNISGVTSDADVDFGVVPLVPDTILGGQDRGYLDVSESFEARYTRIKNLVLYARGEWLEGQGDLFERSIDGATGAITITRKTDDDRFTQKYSIGANYYPLRNLNASLQYYHKIRENDYTHPIDNTPNTAASGNRYPAYLTDQNFDMDDVNFRVTWRPHATLSLVGRYDLQLSTINSTPSADSGLGQVQSADMHSHIISGTVNWTPLGRLYVQAGVNYVMDTTKTPASDLTGAAAGLVLPSKNDYWTLNAMVGFALDQKTDLQVQYNYYRADNYVDNSLTSLPFGSGAEEQTVSAGVTRQINRHLRYSLKYTFDRNRDQLFGGMHDYDAHVVTTGVQYRF